MDNVNQKILLLLAAGVGFSYAYHPGRKWQVIKDLSRVWKSIDEENLCQGIRNLHRVGNIEKIPYSNTSITLRLTKKGKLRILQLRLDAVKHKHQKWDGKWRMVAFDIPEKYKRGRDALRQRLRSIGFTELQKSILITPYDCEKEIAELVVFFDLKKYVRFGILIHIDNEAYFKKLFRM